MKIDRFVACSTSECCYIKINKIKLFEKFQQIIRLHTYVHAREREEKKESSVSLLKEATDAQQQQQTHNNQQQPTTTNNNQQQHAPMVHQA